MNIAVIKTHNSLEGCPLLSVCIPTYNAAKYLPEAINSIISQDFKDYELIIVDNASGDNTDEIVASIQDPRICYYKNPKNVGALENHNVCLSYASGKYVKFLCSDDVLQPGVLRKMINLLESDEQIGLVTHDIFVTDRELRVVYRWNHYPGRVKGEKVVRFCLERALNWIGGPSDVMFRRKLAEGLRFDPHYTWFGDFKFFCQLLLRSKSDYCNLDEPGSFYRTHNASDTVVSCPPRIKAAKTYDFLKEMQAFNHLNCAKLIFQPVGLRRKLSLVCWIILHLWDIKAIVHLLTSRPVGPHRSILQRLINKFAFWQRRKAVT